MGLPGLSPIEQQYQYGAFGGLTGGRKVGGGASIGQPQPIEKTSGLEAGIAAINGEIKPTYGQQDSSYTTGLGHSKHKFMLEA